MPTIPDAIIALFLAQQGAAARRQLLEYATDDAIQGWVRHGLIVRVNRGVYRLRGTAVTPHLLAMAAVLRCGNGAVAGPRLSAALHGIEGFQLGDVTDVAVPTVRRLRRVPFPLVAMDVDSVDRTTVDDVPALSAARALIALVPDIGEKEWRVALDSARRKGCLGRSPLEWLGRRATALTGDPAAHAVLERLGSGRLVPDGEGERRLQDVLVGFEPQPEWGVTDLVPNRRLDCAWRHVLLALEYDGRDHHVLPTDRDSDGLRDLECEAYQVTVIRITKGMLDHNALAVRQQIERIYDRRLLELAGRSRAETGAGAGSGR